MSRFEDAAYRLLLRAFPARVRAACAEAMTSAFREHRRLVAGRPLDIVQLWALAIWDALWHGALDRSGSRLSVTSTPGAAAVAGARRGSLVAGLGQDLRYAWRRLRREPGFAAVVILTLALGIGATSAIFSVLNGVLLEPLPFPQPDRLVRIFAVWKGQDETLAPPNFLDLQRRTKTLAAAAAYQSRHYTLTGRGDPTRLDGAEVSAGFFDVLDTQPLLGRTFTRDDNTVGRTAVVVLGYGLWTRRFGGDRGIVGRTITLEGRPVRVVGVMPKGFEWPLGSKLWSPVAYDADYTTNQRSAWFLDAIGRLAPGVTLDAAASEAGVIAGGLERQYPDDNAHLGMRVTPLLDSVVRESRLALEVLFAAVCVVLLIASVNVANLLLARSAARDTELAVRSALGAGRVRIVRQLLTESVVLAAGGGTLSLALAAAATRALAASGVAFLPRLGSIAVDGRVVAFTAVVSMGTALFVGLVPAVRVTRHALAGALRERAASAAAGVRGRRLRNSLVVAEVALAVLLVAGAGLLIRSFVRLMDVAPGFAVDNAATFRVTLPEASYDSDGARTSFLGRVHAALAAVPGVTGVGTAVSIPPAPLDFLLTFEVKGRPPLPPTEQPTIQIRIADADYFRVMGIPVLRGRAFTRADRAGSAPVVLLTETAVRRFFPREDPIGQQITIGWHRHGAAVQGDVVGVVGDVKSFGLDRDAPPTLYLPFAQVPAGPLSFVVRTEVPPDSVFPAIRRTLAGVDPSLPVVGLETLDAHVRRSVSDRRFYMLLLALFAGVALVLAAVGIFGVLSYLVAQRTREIGIRVALGAGRGSVTGLVVGQALLLTGAGIALGTAGALGLSGYIQSMLFELRATDATTFALVAAALMVVAVAAAWLPARRAARVDPMTALRID